MRSQIIAPLVFIFISMSLAYAEDSPAKPAVTIGLIKLNGKEITGDSGAIAIGKNDSIAFSYAVNRNPKAGERFFYRISLSDGKDSAVQVTGVSSASYKGLAEGSYYFSVGAFDLRGAWNAEKTGLRFIVDDKLAARMRDLKAIKKEAQKGPDTLAKASEVNGPGKSEGFYAMIGFGALLLVAGVGYFAIKNKRNNESNNGGKSVRKSDTITVSAVELEKLRRENGELLSNISALRGQIDALQFRGDELRARNRELEGNVARLSKSKDELEELQTQKDELFAIILHDIKNPISLIKSLVELLRSYDLTATEQQEIIDDIAETTIKIVSLSHEVSKILALESSHLKINLELADLSQLVSDVVTRNGINARAKEIKIMTEIPDSLPNVPMDISKIDEVVDNLVSNSIKFTQRGGAVKVSAHRESDSLIIEVADNGPGLSEGDIESAFQRGNRLTAQPTAGESSTGLGLWIVKKLVEAHKGRVWIKSVLGKGATFAFSLPINPEVNN